MPEAAKPAGDTVASWLARHGGLPRLELELLLCRHLDLTRAGLTANPDQPVEGAPHATLTRDVGRLSRGEPLAYILGEREFWDFTLEVSPAVLIPRPETETLVEEALARLQPGDRVLDLGTGSGAIAIALARAAEAAVVAVDASTPALEVAARNAARLGATVEFRHGNWFEPVPERFRMIAANPPYVAEGDPHLKALAFEPMEALISGPDGLRDLDIIIANAPDHLAPGGWLLVEHGWDQADAVARRFRAVGFEAVSAVPDLGGQPRVTAGRLTGDPNHG